MAVQDATTLKTYFETTDVPTAAEFGHLIDTIDPNALVKPFEYFGGIASAFDTSGVEDDAADAVDNFDAFEDASEWCNGTGGTVLFGGGVYGVDGTIRLRSNLNFQGLGRNQTKILQLNTAWPTVMAPLNTGTPASDGAAFITLKGMEINGGWNFQADISTSGNWRHFGVADMTQIGVHLFCPTGGANDLLDTHRTDTVDAFNVVKDVTIRNVAGQGLHLAGRGECFIDLVRIASCATDGMEMSCVDNWLSRMTIHNCGNRGLTFNAGGQRLSDIKAWYIGMIIDEEPQGVGIEFSSSVMTAISAANLSVQDTYGPSFRFRGKALKDMTFEVNEPPRGRIGQFGQGWQGTRTRSNSALEVVQAENCQITLAVTGSVTTGTPYLVDFNGSAIYDNEIDIVTNARQGTPVYNTTTPIRTSAGYTNNKCYNKVRLNGSVIHGAVTQARLLDATDQVNTYKGFGFEVPVTDGANGRVATRLANGTWEMNDETILTPV